MDIGGSRISNALFIDLYPGCTLGVDRESNGTS